MFAVLAALLAAGILASGALADGDPASDVLVSQVAFVPSDTGASARQQAELVRSVDASGRAGYPLRVAIIPDGYDLGSVTALWAKPRAYAEFLGIELSYIHKQPLLVVMPDGIGFYWQGHSAASADRELAGISTPTAGAGLLTAAETAVRTLATNAGFHLSPQPQSGGTKAGGQGGVSPALVIGLALAIIAAAAAVAAYVRRRRSAAAPRPVSPAPASPPLATPTPAAATPNSRAAAPVRMRWAIPSFALLAIVAVGIPILALVLLRHPAKSSPAAQTDVATPFTWAPHQRPAPNFRLTDQNGHPITLAAFRGRPVIITFVDPLCRNLCPLAAHVLNQVDASMPASERPAIIAVSVDIYADKRADLMQDFQKWSLVPQWHWAVGTPKQLAAVWKAYKVGVLVTTKRIAGTTVHYITHDEIAYVIDPGGDERGLFVYPYSPPDFEHFVARVGQPATT